MGRIEDYFDKMANHQKIFDNSLIKEMVDYSKKRYIEHKVLRIYGLCIQQNHFELATRICKKYNQYFISAPNSDIAMAFCMALKATKKETLNK